MLESLRGISGEVLDVASYHTMADEDAERLTGPLWKLERAQYFHEPDDDPSWQAFLADDWAKVLAEFEDGRSEARAEAANYARQGSELRRLRVVERPVSRYLLWEMQWFAILAEEGIAVRVLDADRIRGLEREAPLPELLVNDRALYQVRYDEDWRPSGARRIADPEVVRRVRAEIAELWEQAEPLETYFRREIAPLMPAGLPRFH